MSNRDYIELSQLNKKTTAYYFLLKPDFLAFACFTTTFVLLFLVLAYSIGFSLAIAVLAASYVRWATPPGADGIPHILKITGRVKAKYVRPRINDHIGINYFNRESKQTELTTNSVDKRILRNILLSLPFIGPKLYNLPQDYLHIASLLGIYGIKENIISLGNNHWAAIYKISPAFTAGLDGERRLLEEEFQKMLNMLNGRNVEFQVFLNKKELRRDVFETYLQILKKRTFNEKMETLKQLHIDAIETELLNTTLSTHLELHLAIYLETKSGFLTNNQPTWQRVKDQYADIVSEIKNIDAFTVRQLSNLNLKVFIADLYQPLDRRDFTLNLINQDIDAMQPAYTVAENDTGQKQALINKVRKTFQNKLTLQDLEDDVLNYLPYAIDFDCVEEHVKVDDYYETSLAIPTNNKIVSNKIIREIAMYDFVTNISFRCVPKHKNYFVDHLETQDRNERNELIEYQSSKDKSGGMTQRKLSELHTYLEEVISDPLKEVFEVYLVINVSASSKQLLTENVSKIRQVTYDRMGVKLHKALHSQKEYYLAAKICPHARTRDALPIDTMRLAKLIPLPWYVFNDKHGFLLGKSAYTGEPTFFDPANFETVESGSAIVLAKTRHGKSALLKQWLVRSSFLGYKNIIIDNTGEYTARVAKELDYQIYKIGTEHVKINPFQLFISNAGNNKEVLDAQINDILIPTLATLLQDMDFRAGIMDKILQQYYSKNKTHNINTFLKFLVKYVKNPPETANAYELELVVQWLDELARYSAGSLSGIFGETNNFTDLHKHNGIVFDVSELDSTKGKDSKKHMAALMHIIVANLWIMAKTQREPRFVFIDEAHHFLGSEDTASFLAKLSKEGGKDQIYPIISTQDLSDFLSNDYAQKIITNTYTKIYGRLDHIPDEYKQVLEISSHVERKLKTMRVGEFFIQRKGETMFFLTEFLNDWEAQICDTQLTDYRKSLEDLVEIKYDKENSR